MLDTAETIENMSILYSQNTPCPEKTETVLGYKHISNKFLAETDKAKLIALILDHGFPINRIWVFPWYNEDERTVDIVCGLDESAKNEPLYIEGMLRLDLFDVYEGATIAIHCIWDNALNATTPNGVLPEWKADWTKTD